MMHRILANYVLGNSDSGLEFNGFQWCPVMALYIAGAGRGSKRMGLAFRDLGFRVHGLLPGTAGQILQGAKLLCLLSSQHVYLAPPNPVESLYEPLSIFGSPRGNRVTSSSIYHSLSGKCGL